ncbi:MAM domain-containing glycosylphosphatidylinositol anchor protein 2-like [Lytechinus variegatus]|uniref:MAM domain-containing glycosylphosphatidylinositol anchor protein 2-like n=1 Tax=Lytechinus variegatus TaxID=7654 RepID=UPI001BB28E5C|nr:MAM domain-containing glycosylphosphatidylinositol anchor protein 2-like [Lytechinus variegatus]
MYTEASSQSPGDYAIMRSPDIVHLDSSTAKNLCFAFSYHMYGLHVGTLDLYFSKSATSMHKGDLVWSMSGEQGDRWIEKEIRVTDFISTSKAGYFIFEGRILTYTSDMAIDDISLGPCSGNSFYKGLCRIQE